MTKLSKRKTIKRVLSSALAATLVFTSLGLGNFSWADDTTSGEIVVTESEPTSEDPSIIISTNVGEDEETSSEESSELKSEEELSEEKNSEDSSEKDSSEEKSSEELEKEDTKKSNIEVTFDEGVTVTVKNDDTTVIISKNGDNVYILDKDNNSFTHPYDDKFIIDDFDVDEDIDISFAANDNYVLTDYSISNGDEVAVEESEVEKLEYNTKLTAADNIYININTDATEGSVDVSTLDDNQKYIYENVNSDYIDKVTKFLPADMILLKSTVADKHKLSGESFEGLFTSNEDQIAEAFLYQSDDVIGLYDLNKKSDYLVGIADTLKDDDDFSIIDYTFAKSNTDAELLDGAIFDTETGLFYVPKSLIDYLEDGTVDIGSKQLQILYAFDDGTDNIEIKEIEDEKGKTVEVEVNMAAPKVFKRMAAPRLLGASAADVHTVGKITGNVQVGDTAIFRMNYGYSTEDIGYGKGYIYNTNVLATRSDYVKFFESILRGTGTDISSLSSNFTACFPHRLIFNEPTTYNFESGATMTINPGVYALECIHTNQRFGINHAPKSPNDITARILAVDINGDSGYVYVGLTCPETNTQSGAGVIKLQYQNGGPETPQEKYGGFSLIKKDNKGNTLGAGFKFAVYDMNDRYVATITTDSTGIAKLSNVTIPLGQDSVRFTVREISVPDEHYSLDPNIYGVDATEGGENQIKLTFVDTLLPQVTVKKVDTDGNWLKQYAYCQILNANKEVVVGAFECGYHEITKSLPGPGVYYLHEWKVPDGYLPAEDVQFTVTDENTTEPLVVMMSDPYITVEIDKKSQNAEGEIEGFLPGAHLFLYRKVAEGYDEYVTDWETTDSGHIIKALPAGEYKLEEHEAPEGYVRAKTIEFEVEAVQEIQYIPLYNEPTRLSILKVDEEDNPLIGAKLALYYTTSITNNGKTEYSKGELVKDGRWMTDGTPHILYGLPTDQVYWLEEEEAPLNYTNFGHQLIQFGHQHTDECYANETTPWPLVYATDDNPNGAGREMWLCTACGECLFYSFFWSSVDESGHTWSGTKVTTDKINQELMRFGSLDQYYINASRDSFTTTQDANHTINVRDLFPTNMIKVFKDSSLKNADGTWKMNVADPNYPLLHWSSGGGSAGARSGYRFETNPNIDYGEIDIDSGYRPFMTGTGQYSLRGFHVTCKSRGADDIDTQGNIEPFASRASWDPADHYSSNGGELICGFAEADDLDNFVIKVYDKYIKGTYGFQVQKVNDRGIPISGAKLSVYKINGTEETLVRSFVSTTAPELFPDVEPGNYKLVEDEPPAGYASAEPVEFTVDSTDQLVTITLTDPLNRIFVSKKLVSDGNAVDVPGAEFVIVDTDDNIVDRWISNGDRHEVTGKLSVNTEYILREVDEISGTMNAGDFKFKLDDTGKVVPISYNSRTYTLSSDGKTITCYNRENVVSFIKQDENGNPLKGATLRLIRKDNGRVVDTWVSGDDGETNGKINPHVIKGLAEGTYIFREIQAPPGFFDAAQNVDQEIEITDQSETFTFTKTNIANKAEFIKIDAKTKEPLADATLALWKLDSNGNPSSFIEEWVTDGTPHNIIGIPTGDYVLFELQAPEGYDYANALIKDNQQINSLRFTITNSEETQTITVEDPRVRGEFELLKVDSVTGKPITDDTAEFEFLEYNSATDSYEVSQHYWIEYVEDGLYSVSNNLTDVPDHYLEWTPQNEGKFAYRETKAPSGAILDPNTQYIDLLVEDLDESVIMSNDTTHACSLHPGEREWTLDGHKVFLGHNAEPTGGFDAPYVIFNDTTLAVKYKGKVFANATYKGGFELVKWDNDAIASGEANTSQGDVADLSEFEFKLYNRSGKAVYVYPKGDASEKVKVENNELVAVYTYDSAGNISTAVNNKLITDRDGYVGIPHKSLQAGTYELIETKAKGGYNRPSDNLRSIRFEITKDDEYFHFEYGNLTNESGIKSDTKYFADDVIKGDVQLVKYDKELNKSEALSGKLEGVEFEIVTKSENPVYVDGKWYNKNDVVATITTHWNADKNAYTAETTGKLLPYGSYTIREKTAGEGYIKTDAIQNFTIREDGELVTLNTAGELLKFSNQVIRGDVKFVKLEEGVDRQIKAPFLITNLDTGEKHIVVTNAEGKFSSATTDEIKHSTNTNGYDALLETYATNPDYAPKADELDDPAGIWFGIGENETVSPVDDTLCALPYGNYKLEELRCHSNLGLDLVTVNFTVDETITSIDNKSVDLDVIYNYPTDNPKITSSAIDSASKTHAAKADKVVTITDRVTVNNLVSENEYKVVGYLIDKKTNEKIKYNNVEVADEYTFVADGTKEICDLSFTFDASTYAGNSVVVYLYLYKASRIVANEITDQGANINNISETVYFPAIHTSLEDEFTEDNVLTAETVATSKVIDTVSYKNLALNTANDTAETIADIAENQTYTIKGKLYDKTTNQVVATSEITFTPTTTSGTVEVPYEFAGVNGHTYVATEELYANDVLIAEHNNLEDELQTVYSPSGRTEAIDTTTNSQTGVVGKNQVIKDTVYYENLVIGKTYTVKGTLMNKETNLPVEQNGAPVTASKIFTASKTSGHVELEFAVDTSLFGGQSIVVFEDMYHKDIKVFTHADINDKDQTISYPDLKTTAIDTNTTDNVAIASETTITDTVQCSNLIVGNSYTIKGTLMDKTTGEYLGKDLGLNPITASKEFTAEANNQTVDVVFALDGSLLQGKTCVVFEDLYLGDELISTHEMLDDVDQTVYFPSVHTTAITDAGLKEQLALNNQFVYDQVELNNLVVGKEYTVTGKVYDKDTKEAIKDGGNFITSSMTFKATNVHMVIELEFNITDASKFNGKTMVVFEKLYHNDFVVATHEDINDFEQSVKYPKVETNAFDINTKLDEVPAKDGITISDEVIYTNLEKNATYTVKGTIYRKDTNEPLKFNDGYIIGTTTFIAKDGEAEILARNLEYVQTLEELDTALASAAKSTTDLGKTESEEVVSGKIDVVFDNINTEVLRGKTMVAFEYLYRDDVLIGIHADINDKNQDIKVIDINTFAREKASGIQEIICSKETNIVDTITISNVVENTTYAITSKIVDIETDEVIAEFKNNHTITTADYVETKDGYKVYNIDVEMTIDSTNLGGRSFVIYEYVNKDDVSVALHEDKDDLKQRLYFPAIGTTAKDSETKDFDSLAEKDDVLIDTVAYENLTKGELYYVVGTLMDKETGLPVVINDKEVTSTTYFIAGEDVPLETVPDKTRTDYVNSGEKVNGTIDVTFKFDSTSLEGKDVVVFEKTYTFDNIIVGQHEDINDKGQTISYVKIRTTLLDEDTNLHESEARKDAVYVDTVKCTNLRVGKEYTVTGTLVDKETGKPLTIKGATSSTTFTATEANCEVEVKFTIDATTLNGKTIVCFEDLYRNGRKIAVHADINDKDQTVFYPSLKTTAIDTNTTDNVAITGETTITDTVQCSNLIVGDTYTVEGILMDKSTGEYLGKDLGLEPITASKEFTAEAKDQTVDVIFALDGSLLQGKTCVVFEDLYHKDAKVYSHADIEDVDQTVYFPSVHTTALADTGLKEQLAQNGKLVYDYVELNNLVVGKEYTVTGKMYDKTTKTEVEDNGDFVTSSQTFTATDTHMIIELKFNITDANKLNGKTMVAFEKLYHNGFVVATHEDINDFEQSIKYPKIGTKAFDIDTKLDEVSSGKITINDEVDYTNLEKDATYTIKGTIYRKDTNKPLKFADGYVVGTTTFIAKDGKAEIINQSVEYVETLEELNTMLTSATETTTELGETKSEEVVSGKVNVTFNNIDTTALYGKTMVAFEYLYRDSVLIGIHADIEDENQDIKTLDISTFAREKTSGIQEIICSKETNITDTVTITNATEGNTYAITSKIVDIETDEVIAEFKDNYKITNANYVETKDGYKVYNVDIDMTIDSTELGGRSFVIYEYIERDGVLLALHEDKDDSAQRLYFPVIGTTAKDSETKDFDALAKENSILIDTVAYENLTKGELYYVVGTLMDKETGLPVVINDKEVTSTTYFIAGEDVPLETVPDKTRTDYVNSGKKVNGTIDVTFKFDSTSLAGKDVVVFEKAYTFDNIIVGRHEDINDKDQTISYPKVSTTLIDKSTKQHEGTARSSAIFIDTVKCTNLRIGQEYTITGTLVDKETGKPLTIKGATSSTTFTATEANCEVEVKFTLDTTSLGGKTIVCFEELYRNDHKVAVHNDITDKDQSVKIIPPSNDSATKYVKVKIAKVDKTKPDKMLAGAEITIFNADGTVAKDINGKECIGITDKDGLVWFHLYQNPWDHYYAQETKAPNGYALCSDKFPIYATDDMSKDADNAYQINITVYDLPNRTQTGDTNNVLPFALGGIALLALAGTSTIFILKRKKKEDGASEE